MNKLLSKIAIAIASFAMVLGGVSIASSYGKKQVEPAYATEEESLSLSYDVVYRYPDAGDFDITVTPHNFEPTEYTWTSTDESVATVSGTGATAIVHPINPGQTQIQASAEGTNGTIYSNKRTIYIITLEANYELGDTVKMQPSSKAYPYIRFNNGDGDIVCEAASSNPDVAYLSHFGKDSYGYYVTEISSGAVANTSATITLTFKDRGGAPDCHVATRSFTVDVGSNHVIGDRIIDPFQDYETKLVLLANNDETKFVYVDYDYDCGELVLRATDDIKKASLFAMDECCTFEYYFFNGNESGNSYAYVYMNGNFAALSTMYSNEFNDYFGYAPYTNEYALNYSFCTKYPGALTWNHNGTYLGISEENNIESFNAYYSDTNVKEPLFAYSATIELFEGETADINVPSSFSQDVTYEILSGNECIEEVRASETYNYDRQDVHVVASNTPGAAVIRVKTTYSEYYVDVPILVKSTAKLSVENTLTQAKLSYSYTVEGNMSYTISDVAIRFGGMIEKDEWDELNTNFGIEAFGVMLSDANLIEQRVDEKIASEGSFDDAVLDDKTYSMVKDTDIKVFYDYLSSGREPAEQGNYYFWNLYKQINETTIGLTREYTAVAFILTSDGDVVFFDEITKSAARLARELNTANPELDATLDGSLSHLANLDQEN